MIFLNYHLIVINLFFSVLLLVCILFYKFIFPQKKINLLYILIFVSLLPLISLLRPGTFESGDFNIHIYRIMSFYSSLVEGHFMPSWAGQLNGTYGNPLFIFNYNFPYYFISFFHLLGISFINSMKIYLGLTFFLSGIFMYFWVFILTKNKLAAFTSGIFYIFSPYHLVDYSFRATLGELTVFTITPLIFLFLSLYINKKKFLFLVFSSFFTALLFAAHPLVAIPIFAVTVIYAVFMEIVKNSYKSIFICVLWLFLGALSSTYLWVSFIIFAQYTFPAPPQAIWFIPFVSLFYSPWLYGFLFQGHRGELALFIGYTQILVVVLSIVLLAKNKIPKNIKPQYIFWIIILSTFLFFVHPSSKPIWNIFHSLITLLATGRLLLPISLCTSVIAGYFTYSFAKSRRKKVLIYIIILFTISSTILNWGHRTLIVDINDSFLQKNLSKSTAYEGVTAYFLNTKWADINNFWFSDAPTKNLEILSGNATVVPLKRTSVQHTYIIDAKTSLEIKENTLYFPGWTLKSDNKHIYIYPAKRGVINAKLNAGLHYVELYYEDIFAYKFIKTISLILFCGIAFLLIFLSTKQLFKRNKLFF